MYRHQTLTVVPLSVFSHGVRAQAAASVEAFASRLMAVSVLVHDMLRLPSGKVRCPVSAMVAEAGGGVRATIAKLPLPCSKVRGC
ncbi:hypothetical protein PR003_g34844 [Phytophthora rubi]|uniref:Uncharacterized protein n=1 Tax=Phytophthora rubi TaxID=129364 RepID=A0A6A4APQ0_9STRA|nr:hypothetical protein PR003_g34844 [Phytophthora rubi]